MTSVKSGVLFCFLSILLTGCFAQEQSANYKKGFVKSLLKDCVTSYSLTCLKLDLASWFDRLSKNSDYPILPGVDLVRDLTKKPIQESEEINEIAREFPEDPYARLDAYLVKKARNFLSTHSLKVNLGKDVEEGRGKSKGGGGGMGIILGMGALMKGMMMAKALAVITAIAGKALMLSLVSMIVSAILGSKHHHHHERSLSSTEDMFSKFKRVFMENIQENLDLPAGLQPDYKPA